MDQFTRELGLELVLRLERRQLHLRCWWRSSPQTTPARPLDRRVEEPAAALKGLPRTRACSGAAGLGAALARRLPLPVPQGRAEARAADLIIVLALAGNEAAMCAVSIAAPEAPATTKTIATAMPCTRGRHRRRDPMVGGAGNGCRRGDGFSLEGGDLRQRRVGDLSDGNPKKRRRPNI